MKENIKQLNFFNNIEIEAIKTVSENEISIKIKGKEFKIVKLPLKYDKDVEIEIKMGLKAKENFPNFIAIDKKEQHDDSIYKIYEGIEDNKKLINERTLYKSGLQIGRYIKYSEDQSGIINDGWAKKYLSSINKMIYQIDISKSKPDNLYIVLDYINENKYLLKDYKFFYTPFLYDETGVEISEDGRISLSGQKFYENSDFIYRMVNFPISDGLKHLKKGIMDGYIGTESKSLFFKRYNFYYFIDKLQKVTYGFLEEKKEVISEKLKDILKEYRMLESIFPDWYLKLNN